MVIRYMSQLTTNETMKERGLIPKGRLTLDVTQSNFDVSSRLNRARWTAMKESGSKLRHSS